LKEIRATMSLRESALRAIRAGIVTGEIKPDELYSAPVLAAQLVASASEHAIILDCIERGDAAAAEAEMVRHLRHTRGAWAGMAEDERT
jgi:DNA-binding GntR family transcriptional regulator